MRPKENLDSGASRSRLANSLTHHDFVGRDEGILLGRLSCLATTAAAAVPLAGPPGTAHHADQVEHRPGDKKTSNRQLQIHWPLFKSTETLPGMLPGRRRKPARSC